MTSPSCLFDPAEFLKIAKKCKDEASGCPEVTDPCYYRVAVGRAYYAAFLKIRDYYGVQSNAPDIHELVSKKVNAQPLQNQLRKLRKKRNEADYEMTTIIDKSTAEDCIKRRRC